MCLGFFASCACGMCCGSCAQCTTPEDKFGKISRIPYLFLLIIASVFAIIMDEYGEKQLNLQFYSTSICGSECEGHGSVYRVSFCLFIFELIHVIIVPCAYDFHWLWFPIKFILFVVALICVFVIGGGNHFFNDYADYFARYVSIIYLFIQILIIIDYTWRVNEWSQRKADEYRKALNLDPEEEANYRCTQNPYEL